MGKRSTQRRSGQISTEPLINSLHHRLEYILVCTAACFIIYTTGLPTIYDDSLPAGTSFLSMLVSGQDFAQNIVLYIPLGFFLSLLARKRRIKWYAVAGVTLCSAAALSCAAEFVQQFFPGRSSSVVDVFCNITGAGVGGASAYFFRAGSKPFRRKLRDLLAHQPIFLTFLLAAAIYVLLAMVPFQLDLTPRTADTMLNPARLVAFTPTKAAELIPHPDTARAQYDHAIDLAVAFCSFTLIGLLASLSLQDEMGFGKTTAGLATLWMILLLAVVMVLAQMFVHHRGFQIIFVPAILSGAALGVLVSWTSLPSRALSRAGMAGWGLAAVLFSLMVIGARELSPFAFDFSTYRSGLPDAHMAWIPFQQYFASGKPSIASSDMLAKFGRFFVLGLFAHLLLQAVQVTRLKQALHFGAWGTLIIASSIETLQVGCPARFPDITHVLLALGGALCGMIALRWWQDLIRSYHPRTSAAQSSADAPIALTM